MMERKTGKAPHWIFYVIAVLLALIAVLLVLLLLKPDTAAPDGNGQNVGAAPSDQITEAVGIPLDGKWTTLYLPRDLEHTLTPVRKETETGVVLQFVATVEQQEVELFSIELSEQQKEGYQLGILHDTLDGDIYVYTSVNEQSAQDWSGEAFSGIEALQQRINDLISQFYEDARFQAVH